MNLNVYKDLIDCALNSQNKAYTPYSQFKVGAAVLTESGKIYGGCNIENASYTPTVCAERVAIFKAIFDGEMKIKKIAVVGKKNSFTYPCGVCRQVIREFCTEDCEIILVKSENEYKIINFLDLLPYSFGPEDL